MQARIVYGVSGEGSGHSSRAREMVSHLESRGHEVWVVSYGRGYDNLSRDFRVFKTEGLSLAAADNKVSVVKTFVDNFSRLPQGQKKLNDLRREVFEGFHPHLVITDFEPMTAYLAPHYGLPLMTIDNQHRLRYMDYPCPGRLRGDALVATTVVRAMVPRPDACLVTTFYFGAVKNDKTFLFPPILRREVLDTAPVNGDHILVYLTRGFETFLSKLGEFPRERFHIYGTEYDGGSPNVVCKPFSREGFLKDLAGCKAVMATAGFTLMTEALHLKKPYLAMPMKGQFEQELNGLMLAELGYGKNCRRTTSEAVGDFLYRIEEYRERLKEYQPSDNGAITGKLDDIIDRWVQ